MTKTSFCCALTASKRVATTIHTLSVWLSTRPTRLCFFVLYNLVKMRSRLKGKILDFRSVNRAFKNFFCIPNHSLLVALCNFRVALNWVTYSSRNAWACFVGLSALRMLIRGDQFVRDASDKYYIMFDKFNLTVLKITTSMRVSGNIKKNCFQYGPMQPSVPAL